MINLLKCFLSILCIQLGFTAQPEYHIATYASNWFESAEYCHRMGMRLAIVDSEKKHIATIAAAKKTGLHSTGHFGVWLGATDLARSNNYVWHNTGERMRYSRWGIIEPSRQGEHCLMLYYRPWMGFFWTWNDALCSKKFYAICESDGNEECAEV